MCRRLAVLALLLATCVACARAAQAGEVLIFVDRGPGATPAHLTQTLAVAQTARRAGHRVRVFAAGQDNRYRSAELKLRDDGAAFADDAFVQTQRFRSAADPRAALRQARLIRNADLLLLLFVGPFDVADSARGSEEQSLERARQTWNLATPRDARIVAFGMTGAGLARLDGGDGPLNGRMAQGWMVLDVADAPTVTVDERPAFAPGDTTLRATFATRATFLPFGNPPPAGRPPAPFELAGDLPDDIVVALGSSITAENTSLFRHALTRALKDGTAATVTARRAKHDALLWLTDALPKPTSFSWDRVGIGARLLDEDGSPASKWLEADLQHGQSAEKVYRLQHTGPEDLTWTPPRSPAPPIFQVDVSAATTRADGVREHRVRVYVVKDREGGFDVDDRATLRAKGADLEVAFDYALSKRVGTLTLAKGPGAPERLAIPMTRDLRLEVKSSHPNAPRTGAVLVRTNPASLRDALSIVSREAGGAMRTLPAHSPIPVRLGDTLVWRVILADDARAERLVDGTLRLRMEHGEDFGIAWPLRIRRPKLELADTANAHYLVNRDGMTTAVPLAVRLFTDGLGDDAVARWRDTKLTVTARPEGLQAFEVKAVSPGYWVVEPTGPWQGPESEIFDAQTRRMTLEVRDARGELVGEHDMEITIAPRWGNRGWLLVGLAVLALVLGVATVWHLRPQPLTGTLLYTANHLQGTVGKLDLSRLGRKRTNLCADPSGRLALGSSGRPIARILPTRVGGMLEIPHESGTPERRLLVEGLSVRVGEHGLRYVSGEGSATGMPAPTRDGPDLLGKDFDMPTGHVDEAYRQARDEL